MEEQLRWIIRRRVLRVLAFDANINPGSQGKCHGYFRCRAPSQQIPGLRLHANVSSNFLVLQRHVANGLALELIFCGAELSPRYCPLSARIRSACCTISRTISDVDLISFSKPTHWPARKSIDSTSPVASLAGGIPPQRCSGVS